MGSACFRAHVAEQAGGEGPLGHRRGARWQVGQGAQAWQAAALTSTSFPSSSPAPAPVRSAGSLASAAPPSPCMPGTEARGSQMSLGPWLPCGQAHSKGRVKPKRGSKQGGVQGVCWAGGGQGRGQLQWHPHLARFQQPAGGWGGVTHITLWCWRRGPIAILANVEGGTPAPNNHRLGLGLAGHACSMGETAARAFIDGTSASSHRWHAWEGRGAGRGEWHPTPSPSKQGMWEGGLVGHACAGQAIGSRERWWVHQAWTMQGPAASSAGPRGAGGARLGPASGLGGCGAGAPV